MGIVNLFLILSLQSQGLYYSWSSLGLEVSNLFLVLALHGGGCPNYPWFSVYIEKLQSIPGPHSTWGVCNLSLGLTFLGECSTYSWSSAYKGSIQPGPHSAWGVSNLFLVFILHGEYPTYSWFALYMRECPTYSWYSIYMGRV